MSSEINPNPEWVVKGKTIKELIDELSTFENQELEVKISIDNGESFKCISLVGKENSDEVQFCGLVNYE